MSYTPTIWAPGKRVTSDDLNKIENELVKLSKLVETLSNRLTEIETSGTTVTSQNLEDLGAVMYSHTIGVETPSVGEISSLVE